jgi:hypothetical protein
MVLICLAWPGHGLVKAGYHGNACCHDGVALLSNIVPHRVSAAFFTSQPLLCGSNHLGAELHTLQPRLHAATCMHFDTVFKDCLAGLFSTQMCRTLQSLF